ncbi:TIGR02646 family protein [Pseudomonas sp. WJP1]|uniref:retron system putative HNH endonuclease n=1 Tax=Pseudomonas sp. WJP1 TaxID=2986947 RepID=UPI00234A8FFF|nr:retron system putative HNH endonuclease [Pseudomonas sp. WJP1]WCM53200.1 TIGR02646 family protein [Pseudomonas sp. WJP1]
MRKIDKGMEPASLTSFKRSNRTLGYRDLPPQERQSIRSSCISEQYGLCAYCCQSITVDNAHNEHLEAQDSAPNRTLEFSNIVASCQHAQQCGHGRKTRQLPLTPLMAECETELKFYLSGLVEGKTERARISIETLNLGHTESSNRTLVSRRKAMVDALIYSQSVPPDDLQFEDEELLNLLLEDLKVPNAAQCLQPFSPVLVNVIHHFLTQA